MLEGGNKESQYAKETSLSQYGCRLGWTVQGLYMTSQEALDRVGRRRSLASIHIIEVHER